MKKIIALLLMLVMLLSLCACGGTKEPKPTPTPLTLDNYKTYLNTSWNCFTKDMPNGSIGFQISSGIKTSDSRTTVMFFGCIGGWVRFTGASPNFNYHDVTVVAKITGQYGAVDALSEDVTPEYTDFEMPVTLELNIAGDGYADLEKIDIYDDTNHLITCDDWLNATLEVVEISGTVEAT